MSKCVEHSKLPLSKIINRVIIGLFVIMSLLIMTRPITVQAEDLRVDVKYKSSGGSSGNKSYVNGVSDTRTGFLCYLVEADGGGSIPGMQAKAFNCQGYKGDIPGSTWGCKSKDGRYSASSWTDTAPWPYTPFNGTSSNGGAIEQWLLADDGTGSGYKNATKFVKGNWPSPNNEIADKFRNGEYALVIETIMSFQPHVSSSNSSSGDSIQPGDIASDGSVYGGYYTTEDLGF